MLNSNSPHLNWVWSWGQGLGVHLYNFLTRKNNNFLPWLLINSNSQDWRKILENSCIRSYIAEEVYEGVVAAVGHGEHVAAEPDHVDVLVTASREPCQCHCGVGEHQSTMMLASCGSNYCVLLINFREYLVEDIVQLERQPGQREQRHHHHQHLDHLNIRAWNEGPSEGS